MSDETAAQPAAAQSQEVSASVAAEGTTSESVAPTSDAKSIGKKSASATDDAKANEDSSAEEPTKAEAADMAPASKTADEKPSDADVEMTDKPAEEDEQPAADDKVDSEKPAEEREAAPDGAEGAAAEAEPTTQGDKSKARRKSTADSKGKKLNKKASKAKILHVDAQPGEHYFAKLKGFPPWPVIIAEEDMLPASMLSTRPVTAARPDGTYREDFADGGKRIADRTFPVMYLHTNEFSWTNNSDLSELDPSTVGSMITTKMRKDLQNAHLLAAEQNSLDYYKNVLREFEEQRLAKLEAKKAKKTPKKAAKAVEAAAGDEDEDVEMADIDEGDDVEPAEKKSKSKKRKAEEEASTPQRSESVKKPKIKITNSSTPKATNGVQSPTTKDSKPVKVKSKATKGSKEKAESKKKEEAPREPELSPEEKHMRKEKEILFLRHRLQKGLLLRDQEPKEEEMKSMSEFLAKLETFPDLEVSIIRATKINKVLKAILKLETIPKEEEFQFKPRSQTLLDKWNKLLATDGAPAPANGVNGASSAKGGKGAANGVKEASADHKSDPEKDDDKPDSPEKDTKDKASTEAESAGKENADTSEDVKTSADETAAEVEASA